MSNAAVGYSSSVSTRMSTYAELLGHHLRSTLNLLATKLASEYVDSAENTDAEASFDFSELRDPGTMQHFMAVGD